jgi:hypothetical protein
MNYPHDMMNWSTVTTASATSWLHSDTEGLGTTTQLLTGAKYWVMFTRDRSLPSGETKGDLGAILFAPPLVDFQDHKLQGRMTAEAIVLRPGDVL